MRPAPANPRRVFAFGVVGMAVTLAASNVLVRYPFAPLADWLTWGAFSYPFAFLVSDCVNRAAGPRMAARVVAAGFVFGAPLSFVLMFFMDSEAAATAARIAAASGIAFLAAQAADIVVFHRLRRLAWWMPPLFSSAPASALDTFLFFFLAFAATGAPWTTWAAGDLAVKGLMALALLAFYRRLTNAKATA